MGGKGSTGCTTVDGASPAVSCRAWCTLYTHWRESTAAPLSNVSQDRREGVASLRIMWKVNSVPTIQEHKRSIQDKHSFLSAPCHQFCCRCSLLEGPAACPHLIVR